MFAKILVNGPGLRVKQVIFKPTLLVKACDSFFNILPKETESVLNNVENVFSFF